MYNDNDLEFTYSIHEDVSDIPMIEREGVLPNNFNIVKELLELNSELAPLNEETFQDRANKAVLSLELMDIDKFIKANDCQEVSNPTFFYQNGSPTSDGLLSNEIFGITQKDRAGIFAYIDLGDWFIDPSCYKCLLNLNKKFAHVIKGIGSWDIDKDGNLVQAENGSTGIRWLKQNFSKLKFAKTGSILRDVRIKYIAHNYEKGRLFINKYIVIPPYYRDVNTSGKHTGVGQINTLYVNLIVACRALKENNNYGLSMADTTCARIQDTLKAIYDWFCGNNNPTLQDPGTGMAGKFGLIRRANMSYTSDYSSRLVLTAPELKAESVGELMVTLDKSAIPLSAAVADFFPFVLFHMRKFFENEFLNNTQYEIITSSGEIKYIQLEDPMVAFSDDILKQELKRFVKGYDNRFRPILVPVKPEDNKDNKVYLMHFKASRQDPAKLPDDPTIVEPIISRPITWVDIIYQCAKKATDGKKISFTRYPYDSYFNTIYTGIEISSTKDIEPLYVNGEFYPFYPKIRKEDINQPTSNKFIDTMQVCNLYLKGMVADYDGDTGMVKGSFFKETNDELAGFVNSKANYINAGCENIRVSSNEAIQALYNLTKVLFKDKSKLTQPQF